MGIFAKIKKAWYDSIIWETIDEEFYDELEESLIMADLGASVAADAIKRLRDAVYNNKIQNGEGVKQALRAEDWEEKADQLRLYSGSKFTLLQQAPAGTVCAVTGLTKTMPGMTLGHETAAQAPALQPVLEYRLLLTDGTDAAQAYGQLRVLEEEELAKIAKEKEAASAE